MRDTYSPKKFVLALLLLLIILSMSGCNKRPARIVDFTPSPASVNSGEKVQLCYELVDANAASIEPSVGALTDKTKSCLNVEPTQTTSYTLFATGADGRTVSRQLKVDVAPLPEPTPLATITLFEPRRTAGTSNAPKSPADLCYEVHGANSVRIEPEVGAVESVESGCRTVSPARTTVYTLTATGSDGRPATKPATVKVEQPAARILKYEVSPVALKLGEAVQICYRVEDASGATIENVRYQVKLGEADCVTVKPTRTTTFTLVASNLDGQSVRSSPARVTVEQPPVEIVDFSARPPEVEVGNQTSLHYEVSKANRVQISANNRAKDLGGNNKGELLVTPAQTTTFILSAQDVDGKAFTRPLTVNVVERQQALVKSFAGNPVEIMQGNTAKLCYEAISSKASIGASIGQGFTSVQPSGKQCLEVKPQATTIYTLTAVGLNGRPENRQATIKVKAPPKPSAEIRLTASPQRVVRGQSAVLSYTVKNATAARIEPGPFAVASNGGGNQPVTPNVTTQYTLRAIGLDGKEVTWQATVQVYPPLTISLAVGRVNNVPALCYEFHGATGARLDSSPVAMPPRALPVNSLGDGKACLPLPPNPFPAYTITVEGPGNKRETRTAKTR